MQANGSVQSAINWLESLLIGNFATTVAVIAVASAGLLLLSGRVEIRRTLQIIMGCFIVFGSATIARGIVAGLHSGTMESSVAEVAPIHAVAGPAAQPAFDPYAGAAVPSH